MFPLELISFDPPDINSADAAGYGTATDGMVYAIKKYDKQPLLPATEWLCTNLADLCGISVPVCKQIKFPNGEIAFGSRWEGGIEDDTNKTNALLGQLKVKGIETILPTIYAFDLFIHNVDRHMGNYLFRKSHHQSVLMAFDFSRALLYHNWPLPPLPLPDNCNSLITFRQISRHHNLDFNQAHIMLDHLDSMNDDVLQKLVDLMPSTWLDAKIRNNLDAWWKSDQRHNRVSEIKVGLNNGTYL